jgi:hypothetical protein
MCTVWQPWEILYFIAGLALIFIIVFKILTNYLDGNSQKRGNVWKD